MRQEDYHKEIEKLKRETLHLTEEKELLIEKVEDIHLLGSISEKLNQQLTSESVLAIAMESVACMKELAYCVFFSILKEGFKVVDEFGPGLPSPSHQEGKIFAVGEALKEGLIKKGEYFHEFPADISFLPEFIPGLIIEKQPNSYYSMLITVNNKHYAMLYVNCIGNSDYLRGIRPLLNRINDIIQARLEILSLISELRVKDFILEKRVKERTAELERSNAELRNSEEKYHKLVEAANDAIIIADAQTGIILDVNRQAEKLLGMRSGEIIGMHQAQLHPVEDAERYNEIFRKNVETGEGITEDIYVCRRDGRKIPVSISASTIKIDGRRIIQGIFRDMTAQKRMMDKLRDSEERYRDLFENANDLIQFINTDGSIKYANQAWKRTLGYSEEEIPGLNLYEIIHPDYLESCMEHFRRAVNGEKFDNIETVFIAKDGSAVMLEGSCECTFKDGNPELLRSIFRDITEHKQAESFIQNILESVDEAFIVIDPEFRIVSANRAFSLQNKLSFDDIIGKHCYEVTYGRRTPCYEDGSNCLVKDTFNTGESRTTFREHFDVYGNSIMVEIKSFPIKDSSGKVTSVIEVINDITEKRKLEEQLRHAQKMEAVGLLAGGISHDFNNILTAIIGYGEVLREELAEGGELREQADMILASAYSAAKLIRGLLTFSRKQVMHPVAVDLNEIINNVERLLSRLIGEDIEIQVKLPAQEELIVLGDSTQIEQVLMNLATNAKDAMPAGGNLNISTQLVDLDYEFIKSHGYGKAGKYALLSISDTGAGMDENTRQQIFEPFFTTKEVGKGTGLGLSVVYGIIKQHEGYIDVYSEPEKGSCFKIYLPVIREKVMLEAPKAFFPSESGMETVLLAEDDADVRKLIKSVLERFGYKVIEAVDGKEAVRLFKEKQESIQLLLFDIIMPKKNGIEAYEAIRKIKPDIKNLFMSGYPLDVIENKKASVAELNFILKPVSPTSLLMRVREELGK